MATVGVKGFLNIQTESVASVPQYTILRRDREEAVSHCMYVNKKPSCRWDSRPYCLQHLWESRDVIGHVTIW